MKRISSLTTVAALGFVFVLVRLVSAHDLWLVPARFNVAPGGRVSVVLNTGDQFPVSEGAVKAERIERATLVTAAGGSTPLTAFRTEGKSTLVDVTAPREHGGAIVEVVLKPVATKQARASFDEFVKHEGLDAVATMLARAPERLAEERRTYAKYAKTLLRVGEGTGASALYRRPLGHRLEIIPDADPFSLKRGEAFPVRLLFDGKPLVNARLVIGATDAATATQSNMPGVRTDAEGRASLRLVDKKGGAHYIHALHM
ncbi:MAG: DUF4198 domain-containing protein, partial [Acidobacteriota bacterium]|nr:DUF4198 domain-containing protein [Acidobacteriota bacterium]